MNPHVYFFLYIVNQANKIRCEGDKSVKTIDVFGAFKW